MFFQTFDRWVPANEMLLAGRVPENYVFFLYRARRATARVELVLDIVHTKNSTPGLPPPPSVSAIDGRVFVPIHFGLIIMP